jgi:serine/threonine protein kinase
VKGSVEISLASDTGVGRVIAGRFTLAEQLGCGSMGAVYRAVEAPMNRDVALKILRADRAIDANARARFLREATTMSRLSSPHTVRVLDFGEAGAGGLFIAMELLRGESLAARLRRVGRFDVDTAFTAIRQVLRSLDEAHAKGVIHRDLKPANLFFAQTPGDPGEELIKVLDFGVAKLMEKESPAPLGQTLAGTVLGTPCYMSPEQALGRPIDARSDLYSLGVIAYELLTGRPPFVDETNVMVMARHVRAAPPPMRRVAPDASVGAEVEAALMSVLSKNPAQRPPTAMAMMSLLDRAQATQRGVVSGVRPALAARWRTAFAAAMDPAAPDASSSRTDDTVRTRAVASGSREAMTAIVLAVVITGAALWMWTGGTLAPRQTTRILKESNGTVRESPNSPKR